jgi:Cys-rich four helix bundle protein (predicted Tat secretion target)
LPGGRSTCDDDNSRLPSVTIEVFISTESRLHRREIIARFADLGAALTSAATLARSTPAGKVAPTPGPLSTQHRAVVDSTAECLRAGRVCLARCTDHLAAGMNTMADCQRAVMNMLSVVGAMADVAGFANAGPANIRSLATTSARFCDTCAAACEPHAAHHEECKACREARLACAKDCNAFAA